MFISCFSLSLCPEAFRDQSTLGLVLLLQTLIAHYFSFIAVITSCNSNYLSNADKLSESRNFVLLTTVSLLPNTKQEFSIRPMSGISLFKKKIFFFWFLIYSF